MRNLITLFLISFVFLNINVFAGDIKQISDEEKPRYIMTVKHGEIDLGEIIFESFPDVAPKHSKNLDSLVSIKFYDGTAFHRVIPGFMIQGGDPNSKNKPRNTWGQGDPSQTKVPAEFSSLNHVRGTLSAARTNDPNSATSQFFICVVSYPSLDGKYSIYGQVLEGMDVADKIVSVPRDNKDNPLDKVEMTIKRMPASSVNEIVYNSGNIKIYPNPTSEYIKFQSDDSDIIVQSAIIRDISGRSYYNEQFNSPVSVSDLSIPVSEFPNGVFYLSLKEISGKEYILRFVIN
jgi:peptidyl-prolyl cis-trans isomerase B (cyclophilin B)